MKAGVGSPNGVVIQDVPEPKPKPTDLLIKIKAIALNRADLTSAKGDPSHGAAAGKPIGSEFSGEVIEVGADVRDFKKGDRVMCHSPGSHAEIAVSDHGRAMKIPDGMSYETAATLPIGLNTLHNALVTAGRLKAGETVMVQGAVVRRRHHRLADRQADGRQVRGRHLDQRRPPRAAEGVRRRPRRQHQGRRTGRSRCSKATGGKGLNLTVDMLSGPTVSQTMRCTALLGRIVNIGRLAGMKAEFDFDAHARQRIDYIGVTFRTRTLEEVREILIKMRADLWDDIKAGRIKVPIDKTYPLADAKAGHEHMRANQHFGKILLIP